jgi:hypothetical protein
LGARGLRYPDTYKSIIEVAKRMGLSL